MGGRLLVAHGRGSVAPMRLLMAARELDLDLVFAVTDPNPDSREVDLLNRLGSVVVGDPRSNQFLRECQGFAPRGILTFAESKLPTTAAMAAALDLLHHPLERVAGITQKGAQRAALGEAGLSVPSSARIETIDDLERVVSHVGLPCIAKPDCGAGSRDTASFEEATSLKRFLSTYVIADRDQRLSEAFVVESLLLGSPVEEPWGDYIALDVLVEHNDVYPVFFQGKFALAEPYRERGGFGPPRESAEVLDQVLEESSRAVRALGIMHGIADLELKLTPEGPRIIEVNGRLGAWVDDMSVRSGGPDPVEIAIRSACGETGLLRDHDYRPRGIAYNYIFVPPAEADISFEDPAPLRKLRDLEGVDKIEIYRAKNERIRWEDGAQSFIGAAVGMVSTHDELAQLADTCEEALSSAIASTR